MEWSDTSNVPTTEIDDAVVKRPPHPDESPAMARTWKTPSSMEWSDTSNVPTAEIVHDHLALATLLVEAVCDSRGGTVVDDMRRTHRAAMTPPCLVVWRWASLKYMGTVTTVCVTLCLM